MIVDRDARSCLAEAARALLAGRITNDAFEERVPFSADPAVFETFLMAFWQLYIDCHPHRLVGSRSVPRQARRELARVILFLKSDQPYAWPVPSAARRLRMLLANLLSLGFANRAFRARFATAGDIRVWPFVDVAAFDAARERPPYLAGARTPRP
jgi:hypothetical protein